MNTPSLKVLIIIDSLGSGGAQRAKLSLAEGLIDLGHYVEIFIYKEVCFYKKIVRALNITIHSINQEKKGFSIKTFIYLRKVIYRGKYDLVISSMHAPSIYAALAKMTIKKGNLVVCEESSSNAPVPRVKRLGFYIACLVSDAVVPTTYDEAKLLAKLPGISKKINTIWNGFNIISKPLKHNLIKNNPIKLLVVARISHPKNGVNLIKALIVFYNKNGWSPKVSWAGRQDDGPRDIEMRNQMEMLLSNSPQIKNNWTWLGEVKNVEGLYLEHDALILVSIYEGVPSVIIEAMLNDCFVIASNICDNNLVLGNDERGLICSPSSPNSICESIEKLNLMSINERSQIINKAKKYAKFNFNQKKMAKSYEALIK